MIGLRRQVATRDSDASSSDSPGARSGNGGSGELLRRAGRLLLWGFIALVFVRGLGAILTPPKHSVSPISPTAANAGSDQAADAFAVAFARVYLSFRPGGEAAWVRAVAPYLASGLRDRAAAVLPRKGSGPQVAQATVARVSSLGDARAMITVASTFTDPTRATRYLTVPVERDANGGLAVFDPPALTAAPPASSVTYEDPPPLSGPYAPEIEQLVARFLPLYFSAQDPSALAYLTAPGATVQPVGGGLALVSVDALGQDGEPTATDGVVEAAVHVRDTLSGAVYQLRYRITITRRGRWYVSAVAGGLQP